MSRVGLFIVALLSWFASTAAAEQEKILSHPPLRKNPPPAQRPLPEGPTFFVDPVLGDDLADGGRESPWRSVGFAVTKLHAGDTLCLRGGSYFENVAISLDGTAERPIVIRSFPGEQAVIDGGIAEFQLSPATAWTLLAEDERGGDGEYRSARAFPNIRDAIGAFADSDIGLQTYWHASDLRSPHELTAPGDNGDLRPQYCGPGIFYDRTTGHLHARLAHTHFKHFTNYRGETDPRKLPLVIAPFRSTPLRIDQARHVKLQDLVIRGGGYETVVVSSGNHIEFDNVTIRGGTYCLRTENTGPFRFHRSALYGNAPPWSFRGDGSLRSRPGKPLRDIARLTCHALWTADSGREFSVYAFPLNNDWEVSHSEFTDSHDGLYLGGIDVRFHHNRLDNFNDDGLYLSPMLPRHLYQGNGARIEIFENLFTRSLTPIAFGGPEDTRDEVFVYRNVFDLRGGVTYNRPSEADPDVKPHAAERVFSDHGSPPWPKLAIYHNTFIAQRGRIDLGSLGGIRPGHPRAVFNNIYFNFENLGGLQPPAPELGQEDGNLYWSPTAKDATSAAATLFARYRQSPAFEHSKAVYPPGFTAHSLAADPQFENISADPAEPIDLRLRATSPAINAGVALPADFPDSLRHLDRDEPDLGAVPLGADFLISGRRLVDAVRGN